MPVTFPPGRPRLAASPLATGSVSRSTTTTGMVWVSAVMARVAVELIPTMMSTLASMSSLAISRNRWSSD
jgi:hypothetical protein